MPFNWSVGKRTVIHPLPGILLNNKQEWTAESCNSIDKSQVHCAKWKKPDTEGYCIIPFI